MHKNNIFTSTEQGCFFFFSTCESGIGEINTTGLLFIYNMTYNILTWLTNELVN